MKKRIAILGSTGSIGIQALEVIRQHSDVFELEVLTAQNNIKLLISQAREFKPNAVVIGNEDYYLQVFEALNDLGIKIFAGEESISQIVEMDTIDIVLVALVGFAGLKPSISAIEAGKHIALANKETIVVAGEIIMQMAEKKHVRIYPVDSEHSAIFQCLIGENSNSVEKIYLTASGGPFLGKDINYLKGVKKEDALAHPNWDMGQKISIDSASLMNKGFEVIEAKWLFGLQADQIEVIIHPQSIIHSIVQFKDGSMKAQMGLPDMKLPILYALSYPERLKTKFPRFNFLDYPELNFETPNIKKFRNLALAYEALQNGGSMPCILNAANEIAVDAFLNDRIGFLDIPHILEKSIQSVEFIKNPTFEDLIATNTEARKKAEELIKKI
ncbi:MAG: 1-deoxy-D-xylulose-5-phosphate reductoisomerase [Bacteroidales bacterium]|nr:1-deoxy-D-xylulose-5-phosphate reductoisomerase [Bacteroidales bacterium]